MSYKSTRFDIKVTYKEKEECSYAKTNYSSQMIEEGKDKLEWYRQVDPTKLSTLKDLINAPNYKDNLGTLIKTIYEFAFLTYSGMY